MEDPHIAPAAVAAASIRTHLWSLCLAADHSHSIRRKHKGQAPRPPADRRSLESSSACDLDSGAMEQKEHLDRDIQLTVVLPDEVTTSTSVHGSKPMMDLLIFLCAQYHLNPSAYTIDLVSEDKSQVKFKPNTPLGMLDVEKVILKPKNADDKNKKPVPLIPEQTVRVVINYKKTQKAVLRASPHVSLQELIPAISSKCELDPLHTILLRDHQSREPLELSKSLNDLGLRELYAADTSRATSAADLNVSSSQESFQIPQNIDLDKQKENEKGFFSFLRRSKKKKEQTASAPATPLLTNQRPINNTRPNKVVKQYESNTLPTEMPKKRRAPLPPMYASQTVPKDFVQGHTRPHSLVVKSASIDGEQKDLSGKEIIRTNSLQLSGSSSNESSLRRGKRKAPAPPPSPPSQPLQDQTDENSNDTGVVFEYSLEGIDEKEESSTDRKEPNEAKGLDTPEGLVPTPSADLHLSAERDHFSSMSQDINPGKTKSPEEEMEKHLNTDGNVTPSMFIRRDTGDILLENNEIKTLDVKKHDDTAVNNFTIVQGEKAMQTKTIELSSIHVTDDTKTTACGMPGNVSCLNDQKNPEFLINGNDALNSTNTTVVKTQDASIQTASFQNNDDSTIQKRIDSGDYASEYVKEKENGRWKVELVLEPANVEMGSLSQMPETAIQTGNSTLTNNIEFVPSEKSMHIPNSSASYRQHSEPKPKPSNEITREYIPKIGMTTYTIVPQKSLEKLKCLDTENSADGKNLGYDFQAHVSSVDVKDQPFINNPLSDAHGISPSKDCTNTSQTNPDSITRNGDPFLIATKNVTNTFSAKKEKHNDTFPKARTNSFYSQLQRRVSSQYVTSAAAKSTTSPTSPTQTEPLHKVTERNVTLPIETDAPLSPEHTDQSSTRALHSPSKFIQMKEEDNPNNGKPANLSGHYVTSAAAKSTTSATSPTQSEPLYNVTERNVILPPETCVPLSPECTDPSLYSPSELIPMRAEDHYEDDKPANVSGQDVTSAAAKSTTSTTSPSSPTQTDHLYTVKDRKVTSPPEASVPLSLEHIDPSPTRTLHSPSKLIPMRAEDHHEGDRPANVSGQYVISAAAKSTTSPSIPTQTDHLYTVKESNVTSPPETSPPLSPDQIDPSPTRTLHSPSEFLQMKAENNHDNGKPANVVIKPPLITPKPFSISNSQSKPFGVLKLRTFTAPKTYSSATPSPFALAVSSAVRRSQSFSKTRTTAGQPFKGDSSNAVSQATSPTEACENSSDIIFQMSKDCTLEQKMNLTNTEKNINLPNPPPVLEKKSTLSLQNSDPELIRQGLLAAIRSGDAAAKLKRVDVRSNTISINGRPGWGRSVSTDIPYKH
ncbi:cordon-bleu protein-like 1 isoform X2 [Ambystoma mexicanum]|uniref:cordon-bleu protein-like 1 isoform X2 n=1 Tax=Ambystoma mexicanum TaxID=8296 RepID=UPI0037E84C36